MLVPWGAERRYEDLDGQTERGPSEVGAEKRLEGFRRTGDTLDRDIRTERSPDWLGGREGLWRQQEHP